MKADLSLLLSSFIHGFTHYMTVLLRVLHFMCFVKKHSRICFLILMHTDSNTKRCKMRVYSDGRKYSLDYTKKVENIQCNIVGKMKDIQYIIVESKQNDIVYLYSIFISRD